MKALAEYLQLPEDAFRSFIVFSECCELKKVPFDGEGYHVCRRHHLVRDAKRDLEARPVIFDADAYAVLKAKLDELKAASSKEALEKHIEEAKAVAAGKVFPHCDSELVERSERPMAGYLSAAAHFRSAGTQGRVGRGSCSNLERGRINER